MLLHITYPKIFVECVWIQVCQGKNDFYTGFKEVWEVCGFQDTLHLGHEGLKERTKKEKSQNITNT